ncbi:transposase family protein [Candidatus Rhabdochlamydia sp. W815]|nr:transposase family protein [Candidatus Rhabdochlamydia sp. W815]
MEGFIHSSSIMMHFSKLPDPRKALNQLYSLHDILVYIQIKRFNI